MRPKTIHVDTRPQKQNKQVYKETDKYPELLNIIIRQQINDSYGLNEAPTNKLDHNYHTQGKGLEEVYKVQKGRKGQRAIKGRKNQAAPSTDKRQNNKENN